MNINSINTVAVIGTGTMGEGIAFSFARAGYNVRIIDQNTDVITRCIKKIQVDLRLFKEFNLLSEDESVIQSRITSYLSDELTTAVKDCQFIIECIPEVIDLKKELFMKLDSCPEEVIISSNTSSFKLDQIGEEMHSQERIIGTHFFMPAHIIPLVEVHRGSYTTDEVTDTTAQLVLNIGKKPVMVKKVLPGFIVNRIQAAIGREANYLLEQGVMTPEDFDMAAKASYGFRLANLGPFAQADINGLDTVVMANTQIYKELCNITQPSLGTVKRVVNGDLGLKAGKGYYDYTGKSREKIQEEIERNFLNQLVLFNQREQQE